MWFVFFLAAFVALPIFLVVLLVRGKLSSFGRKHRAVFLLCAGAGELALGVVRALRGGITGGMNWAQLAWYFVSGIGFLGLAFQARREDQEARISSDPGSAAWRSDSRPL